ncbi:hypothetical protein BG452_21230 [Streptomyces sp. CBMA123]|nr:hypothetical protein [Streptomyces sp. CBMA123]
MPNQWGGAGVEFGGFAGAHDEVVVAQDQAQAAVEDVDPFVALVAGLLGLGGAHLRRDDQFVGLQAACPSGEREHGHAVAGDGLEV